MDLLWLEVEALSIAAELIAKVGLKTTDRSELVMTDSAAGKKGRSGEPRWSVQALRPRPVLAIWNSVSDHAIHRYLISLPYARIGIPVHGRWGLWNTHSQTTGSGALRGIVQDSASGEPVAYAIVRLIGTQHGMYTDENGYFKMEPVPEGRYSIALTLMGYASDTIHGIQVEAGKACWIRARLVAPEEPVHTPGPLYEGENGWQRFSRKLSGRPRRIIGPG